MRKIRILLTTGLCALAMGVVLADTSTLATPHRVEKKLTCGDAQLTAQTDYVTLPDVQKVVWTAQAITLRNSHSATSVPLALESKPLHLAYYPQGTALDSVVLGWTCLKTSSGKHYFFLAYTCTPSPERPACKEEDESGNWDRVLDTSGKRISDQQRERLGINRAIGDHLQLEDPTED
ncbi:hypothetical protein [Dyella flagellata]|uniref:Uncharacterized protein n=1 Tax=Dyella flagellata TaxID=1867833 RepID=A0ABQ5XA86_9GAMM|nr:hypothetical protein [Dyella flagellata]GLQ88586.1 hypothetical protein GCM10007898_21560 [Dyella flagellata]